MKKRPKIQERTAKVKVDHPNVTNQQQKSVLKSKMLSCVSFRINYLLKFEQQFILFRAVIYKKNLLSVRVFLRPADYILFAASSRIERGFRTLLIYLLPHQHLSDEK
jgi:hypothetical protein